MFMIKSWLVELYFMQIFEGLSIFSVINLVGGTCLLLWGLEIMSSNLSKAFGNTLRVALERATENNFIGIILGTVVTGILHSSSTVTVLLVTFVQSQIMTFERSIAIIYGANIGTTFTAQIIAFDLTKWSLAFFIVGYFINLFAKRTKTKNVAAIIIGSALIFFGLYIMSTSMKGLRDSEYFSQLVLSLENVPFGILVGAIFTGIIQSSSAAIGIIQGLAMQDLITIEAAFPFILGANIGTCATAVLACLSSNAAAKRVAAAHVIFNITGATVFAFFVPQFISFLYVFTPADDALRLIANAQTMFNVASVIMLYPFISQLARLCRMIIPDDKVPQRQKYYFSKVKDLSDSPDLLLIQSTDAIRAYKNIVKEMLWISRDYFIRKDKVKFESLVNLRKDQQEFRAEILDFLSEFLKLRLSYKHVSIALNQITLVNEIEHVAYKLESSIETMNTKSPEFDDTYSGLEEYFKKTVKSFSKSCNSVLNNSQDDARRIFENIVNLKDIENTLRDRSVDTLREDHPNYEDEKMNLWVLEFLRSVNATSKRICQVIIDAKVRFHKDEGSPSVIA